MLRFNIGIDFFQKLSSKLSKSEQLVKELYGINPWDRIEFRNPPVK